MIMTLLKITEGILNKKNEIIVWTILAMIMTLLKITEGILNKKNEINSLNNSSNDNVSSQNYRRNLKQKGMRSIVWTILAMIMSPLKITEGILNKKNAISCLKSIYNDEDFFRNNTVIPILTKIPFVFSFSESYIFLGRISSRLFRNKVGFFFSFLIFADGIPSPVGFFFSIIRFQQTRITELIN